MLCDSRHTRERLLHHHPEAPAEVVHPGLTPPPTDRPPRAPGDFFLTVASIEPRKNHMTLLRAFRKARAEGLQLRWKVVGVPGPRSEPILAALRGEPGVDLCGPVDQLELEHLYASAVFLAAPSLLEGFGYPPLEAMARGVPTICATGSGFDDTVGDAALRVDAVDVDGWTAAMLTLGQDSGSRQRLEKAGIRRIAMFPWRSAAGHIAELHRRIHGRDP